MARLYVHIANIRNDDIHKLTTKLAEKYGVIVIEDLNVKGMMANRHLSRALGDMGFREFRRQMEYKVPMHGGRLIVADRWYPSSKICSECDYRLDALPLSVRSWTCPGCGAYHDRDLNSSKTLAKLAVSSTVSACGGGSSGIVQKNRAKLTPVKQESNAKLSMGSFE